MKASCNLSVQNRDVVDLGLVGEIAKFSDGGIAVLKQDVVYRRYGNFFFRM